MMKKHEPHKSHRDDITLDEMRAGEPPFPEKMISPESAIPLPPPVALPVKPPLEEAREIFQRLVGLGGARLGTSHGVEIVNAAIKWLAVHGQ